MGWVAEAVYKGRFMYLARGREGEGKRERERER
jgi:hypothetical protein